jgi:hypothetical protein
MREYVSRSIARGATGGYVLVKKTTRTSAAWKWFFDALNAEYAETILFDDVDNLLLRYEIQTSRRLTSASDMLRDTKRFAASPWRLDRDSARTN